MQNCPRLKKIHKKIIRIEIEPPPTVEDTNPLKIIIDTKSIVLQIVSTLQLGKSDRSQAQSCKVPQGFTVRFVTPDENIEADITISGHKHLILQCDPREASIHFDLPADFEKIISPYLLLAVKSD